MLTFHEMRYDLKGPSYVMERLCDAFVFTSRYSYLIRTNYEYYISMEKNYHIPVTF